MGGHQVTGQGTGDDGYDEDGYDESQRAEILEATRDGPTDGTILTDVAPDIDDDDEEDEDRLTMVDDELGSESRDTAGTERTMAEDDVQDELDDGSIDDDELDDADEDAIAP